MNCARMQPTKFRGGHRLAGTRWSWLALAILLLMPGHAIAQGGVQVENVTWVPATNDAEANCDRLRDTLVSVPEEPFQVVRLAPGFFDCDLSTLFVPSHVSLEGSGKFTYIYAEIDHSTLGVVHLIGQARLSRLVVQNKQAFPVDAAIAVSAWDFSVLGSPTLVDVEAVVASNADPAHPLWVAGEDVRVERGSFNGDDIRLVGGGYTFTLFGGALEGVDADETVTANCYFYRSLTTDAAVVGGACP